MFSYIVNQEKEKKKTSQNIYKENGVLVLKVIFE